MEKLEEAPDPSGPVSLSEALARAVRFNASRRLQLFQAAIENGQIDLANIAMMPEILANAGYRYRNPEYATYNPTFTAMTVAEQQARALRDLSFSWNLLDFGISYLRAKQQADRALAAEERLRRVTHQLVQDTIAAWYRARAARQVALRFSGLLARLEKAIAQARDIEKQGLQEPLEALAYQREALETLQVIDTLRKDLAGADHVLGNMIGAAPETSVVAGAADIKFSDGKLGPKDLHELALEHRPDVRTSLYETRMTKRDATIAVLELLPIPSLGLGGNYDSNKFLVANDWFSVSAQVAQSISKLARYPATAALNEQKEQLAKEQTAVIVGSALLQVDVAAAQLLQAKQSLKTARMQLDVAKRIQSQMVIARNEKTIGDLPVVKEELRAFLAQLRYDLATLDVEAAGARLLVSAGLEIAPLSDALDIEQDAKRIRQTAIALKRGAFDIVTPGADAEPRLEQEASR